MGSPKSVFPTNNRIVRHQHYNRENNEVVELPVAHQSITEFMLLRKSLCLMRSKSGRRAVPRYLNWTAVDVGEPGSGQVRLRQAAAGLNYIDVYHRTGSYSQPLPFIPGLEGAGTVEAIGQDRSLP